MKKIALALLIVLSVSSFAFGITRAGSFGLDGSCFIKTSPLGGSPSSPYNVAAEGGGFFYNFTEDLSVSIGAIYVNDPTVYAVAATDSGIGVILKGLWNLGRGDTIPHLGIEVSYVSFDLPAYLGSAATTNIGVLFGVESMLLPDFSVMLDARLIDYQTMDTTGPIVPNFGSQIALFSGAALSFRWYIL
ncbi:MAG: hypothetical protein NT030_03510 [Candidatus Saganbacteria bacterium]|nr:hypothetical protein [Candidatus Saganbacteria bacterium]